MSDSPAAGDWPLAAGQKVSVLAPTDRRKNLKPDSIHGATARVERNVTADLKDKLAPV